MGHGKQFPPADELEYFVAGQDFFVQGNIRSHRRRQHQVILFVDQSDAFSLFGLGMIIMSVHDVLCQHAAHDVGLILAGGGDKGVHIQKSCG